MLNKYYTFYYYYLNLGRNHQRTHKKTKIKNGFNIFSLQFMKYDIKTNLKNVHQDNILQLEIFYIK